MRVEVKQDHESLDHCISIYIGPLDVFLIREQLANKIQEAIAKEIESIANKQANGILAMLDSMREKP